MSTTWTCWECFGTVVDDDNDGIGYCRDCHMIVGPDGRAIARAYASTSAQLMMEQVQQILLDPGKRLFELGDGIWLAR